MGNPSLGFNSPITDTQVLPRVRLVRVAAWATVALAGVEGWLSFFPSSVPCSARPSLAWLLVLGMAAVPYIAAGWPGRPRNWQLVLAFNWSWTIAAVLVMMLVVPVMDATPLPSENALLGLAPVLLVLQGLVLWNARAARRMVFQGTGKVSGRVIHAGAALAWLALMVVVTLESSDVLYGPAPRNDATAVGSVSTLNTALVTYRKECGRFAEKLEQLGPQPEATTTPPSLGTQFDCEHAALIDATLASGARSGYIFTYAPGKRDPKHRVTAYTVGARPLEYGHRGFASFFSDESGRIRKTCEDRAATAEDSALQ
ncbi:MAG TPA: hypothetical protein VE825_18165 [Terriglobales bacterium]|jgi:hypothetical protein|nr:hypothetical protein [Terriglobales bacterium]